MQMMKRGGETFLLASVSFSLFGKKPPLSLTLKDLSFFREKTPAMFPGIPPPDCMFFKLMRVGAVAPGAPQYQVFSSTPPQLSFLFRQGAPMLSLKWRNPSNRGVSTLTKEIGCSLRD